MLDVAVHPQYAKNGWIYLAYTEVVAGYVAPPPRRAAPAPDPAAAAGARGRGRGGPPSPPSMTVFVRGKIDKNNHWVEEQLIYRAPSELYTPSGSHYGTRFLFDKARARLLQPGRARRHDERAGSVEAARQDPPRQRRRLDSQGQPVREHAERAAVDLDATAIATRRGWRGIRPACSGSPNTVRPAATKSTSSRRARTTAGA